MNERVIRKYANRRLYDPSESRHLTLDEVRQLIVGGERVRVEDAKTGEDLTRSILLQIIVEREEAGRPLLSAELLEQLIRFYGGAMQDFLATYLERSVGTFVEQQSRFQDQVLKMVRDTPLATMGQLAETNLAAWQEFQRGLFGAGNARPQKDDPSEGPEKKK
ncbi:polyhydroxyalkanoate synthesis repressor PhaR [Thioalkalivibrio sp. XN8]|uniref:polyhydroxyalkanoate synthesis repressor PhaR n=1 Tax=Thioalkalivibrio sp. XN8 TaxID=2712863 RepID=UPI0013EE09FB|nr:polyhydroxyalkanoate synthesis repressor PhaR [Thioalkalivibrio sp. XN8]